MAQAVLSQASVARPILTGCISRHIQATPSSASMNQLAKVVLSTLTFGTYAFYPDGHWKRVERLYSGNIDRVVKAEVDAGRTLFVRWIHSKQ